MPVLLLFLGIDSYLKCPVFKRSPDPSGAEDWLDSANRFKTAKRQPTAEEAEVTKEKVGQFIGAPESSISVAELRETVGGRLCSISSGNSSFHVDLEAKRVGRFRIACSKDLCQRRRK